ncbi:MAG: fucose isomerase [Ruminococcaceae bacterium]|nr:fucose isomerase [Oscillospiraceae bacterium]
MKNIPLVKPAIIAVSRDCFPRTLSERRRRAVAEACREKGIPLFECGVTVETEKQTDAALAEIRTAGCNALVVYLGNFGPETPETLLAKKFDGPVMYVGAAEETGNDLIGGRGDAYCGMLNASYNLALRNIRAYIPERPIGTAEEVAENIRAFLPLARAVLGLRDLKVISFGPRPKDFLACNAPIKRLYDLGVEIEENSELDLFEAYHAHKGDARIAAVAEDMARELGEGNKHPGVLARLAQYEITLLDWIEEHRDGRSYVTLANKCWPAFQTQFGFVPCYVNSRLASRGIPIACEVDIWGALSEYIAACITEDAVTLLDINNTVPTDLYDENISGKFSYSKEDVFMGFHCGNTPSCKLVTPEMRYQRIMHSSLEPDKEPDITRGTLEGDLIPGAVTLFRLQSTADAQLRAYVAQGEVLPVATRSFGSIGIIAVPEMARFYRYELIEHNYPHHGAVAFTHIGNTLYELFRYLGVTEIGYNRPKGDRYPTEKPF